MDSFASSRRYGSTRLRHLNYCGLYLQVMFLSELTMSNGTHLINGFWNGDISKRKSAVLMRYPH